MPCLVASRQEARAAADAIEELEVVVEPVAIVAPHEDPTARWTLDILAATPDRLDVPAVVVETVQSQGFGVRKVLPHGPDHHHVSAVARR
jgi:hypothetical protein